VRGVDGEENERRRTRPPLSPHYCARVKARPVCVCVCVCVCLCVCVCVVHLRLLGHALHLLPPPMLGRVRLPVFGRVRSGNAEDIGIDT